MQLSPSQIEFEKAADALESAAAMVLKTINERQRKGKDTRDAWRYYNAIQQMFKAQNALISDYENHIAQQRDLIQRQNGIIQMLRIEADVLKNQPKTQSLRRMQAESRESLRCQTIIQSQTKDNWQWKEQ